MIERINLSSEPIEKYVEGELPEKILEVKVKGITILNNRHKLYCIMRKLQLLGDREIDIINRMLDGVIDEKYK
jgi:biotin operon repressor